MLARNLPGTCSELGIRSENGLDQPCVELSTSPNHVWEHARRGRVALWPVLMGQARIESTRNFRIAKPWPSTAKTSPEGQQIGGIKKGYWRKTNKIWTFPIFGLFWAPIFWISGVSFFCRCWRLQHHHQFRTPAPHSPELARCCMFASCPEQIYGKGPKPPNSENPVFHKKYTEKDLVILGGCGGWRSECGGKSSNSNILSIGNLAEQLPRRGCRYCLARSCRSCYPCLLMAHWTSAS